MMRSNFRRMVAVAVSASLLVQPALAAQQYRMSIPVTVIAAQTVGELTVSPSTVSFGAATAVGAAATPVSVTVTNNALAPVSSLSVALPSGASDFSIKSNNCPTTLAPRSSCVVSVGFQASAVGGREGQLAVSSNAKNGLQLVSLSGTGMVPTASLTAAAFPSTQVGDTSAAAITLVNTSSVALKVTPGAATAPFTVAAGSCGTTLPAGASCALQATFAPSSSGSSSSPYKVTLGVGAYSFERSVTLAAEAQGATATLTAPAHGAVAAGASKDVAATLTNSGVGPISVGTPSVTGSGFSVSGSSCSSELAPGASCSIDVRLTGSAQAAHTGTLSVPTQAGTKTAALSGQSQQAVIAFTPTSYAFGSHQTGSSVSQSITLRNTGNVATGTLSFSAPAGYTVSGSACASGIAAGGSCAVTVGFSPSVAQSYTGNVSATGSGLTASLAVTGSGQAASATLSGVAFGNLVAGSSATQDATLTNTGVGILTLGSPSVSGAGFAIASGGTCSSTLAAGASCTVKVQITAAGTTAHTGTLTIATTEAGSKTSSLSGQSQQATITVNPASRAFGSIQAGQSTTSATHTVTNSGNVAATGLSVTAPSGFGISGSTCATTLAPGASCTFAITFSPSAAQAYSGNVTVASTNGGSPSVSVSGSGQAQSATLTDIDFGARAAGVAVEQTSTLTNTGAGPLSITVPSAASVTGTGFALSSTTCSTSLASGASCSVTVRYTPTATDSATGTLSISTGAGAKTSTLSGQSQQAKIAVSPTWRDFGNIGVGEVAMGPSHTVTNSGNITANGLAITAPTGFGLTNNTCSTSLAAGESCSFSITFSPTAPEDFSGLVKITSTNAVVSSSIQALGTGTQSVATLTSAASITLADWYQSGSITGQFQYRNTGNGPMTLSSPALVSPLSVIVNTCVNVAPGQVCLLMVALSRNAIEGSSSQSFVLSGAGIAPAEATINWSIYSTVPRWSSTSLAFGNVSVGQTATQIVTLSNFGSVAADWSTNNGMVNLPAGYTMNTSACSNVLPAGGSCSVSVSFTPTSVGLVNGSQIYPLSSSRVLNYLSVSGTGLAAASNVAVLTNGATSLSANWSSTNAGKPSGSIVYKNTGGAAATLNFSGLSAPYSASATSCSIPAGGTCTVIVTMETYTGVMGSQGSQTLIATGAENGDISAVVSGTVNGDILGVESNNAKTLSVMQGGAAPSGKIVLRNSGNVAASWAITTQAAYTGAVQNFSASPSSCSVPAGGACEVTVTLTATAAGTYNDSIRVTGSVTGSRTASIAGTVNALSPSYISVQSNNATSLTATYGSSTATSATVTYYNSGGSTAELQFSGLSGTMSVNPSSCVIAAGATCTTTVSMAGTGGAARIYGPVSQTLTAAGGGNGAVTTNVSGTLSASDFVISSNPYADYQATGGSGSATLSVIVKNQGNMAGSVSSSVSGTGYSTVGSTCSSSVAPGATCVISTKIAFASAGTVRTGTLILFGGSTGVLSIPLKSTFK